MSIEDACWEPSAAAVEHANVTRLMRRFGAATIGELHARSVEDPAAFWRAVIDDLSIAFVRPPETILDVSAGPEWARWFTGGLVNVAHAGVHRHAHGDRADHPAVDWEGEDGTSRRLTYRELDGLVQRLAGGLHALGLRAGDRVGLYLPMIPEAVVTFLACASLGLVTVPIFSGFAADAVATRLRDAGARVLVTADGVRRRGKEHPMKQLADAAADSAGAHTVLVVQCLDVPVPWRAGRDLWWHDVVAYGVPRAPVPLDPEAPLLIAYTSGTTGRPKGVVHVHGGFLVKAVEEYAYQLDVHAEDRVHWVTDMGWIVGPWQATAVLALGATLVLYEGAPDHPAPDRLWRLVEGQGVTMLGLSPTLLRALRAHGDSWPGGHDLSTLRVLCSTGEPIDPDSHRWLAETIGGGRCPVINISGGTEVGACFLSPHPVAPMRPVSLQGPALGMDVDIWDDDGHPVGPGEVGHLVCKQPWPAMTRGFWNDRERYLETYWSRFPGVWFHGDWARRDADGHWYVLGRSDDTINVAGKRLGPAEVESVLTAHDAVVEAAAVGMDDELKGQALWCFCVIHPDRPADEALRKELLDLVVERLGSPFRPGALRFVTALPKTRSAKVMRRAVQAVAGGTDPGDLSSLEDETTLDAIRNAR
ncbi:AMP-binding protein [Pseudonocardia sp.]|uniref:AMP-binding protein n=1 Tax=Pseudonocardia sp. TaxID=60912 RepID=UPI002605F39F|nr:AMP-binding protein [Pseudonocardia sp.]